MFPLNGDVIQSMKNLLQSQRKCQKEIEKQFVQLCEKNKGKENHNLLVNSCTGTLKKADEIITNTTEKIKKFEQNAASADESKKLTPFCSSIP